jgi:parallel beta-helix repeat protein
LLKRIVSGIMLILLLISTLTLAFHIQPVKAEPTTIVVPDDYPTIQEAINAATPGDTIFVRAGTYFENVVANKTVSLIGEDKTTTIIDGNAMESVFTVTQDHVNITGFTVRNSGGEEPLFAGIQLYTASYCNISGNEITNNYYGIDLIFYSNYNIVSRNNITANNKAGIMFGVQSSNNAVVKNNIMTNNEEGILICGSSNYNIISGNNITANKMIGVGVVTDSSHNVIYHNNIIKNIYKQAAIESGNNLWDDGYPSGGNYWSDYTGVDYYSGPNQDQPGSDGIGDTPYVIDEHNRDRYPLMKPWSSLPWGDWQHYHDYSEIVNTLLHLNNTYPNIVDVFSIGKSWENRDIYCIRLTNESMTRPKPKVFFVGYHHAREPISAELPLYFAVEAATNFGTNETITHMLNYSEIYIVPALNVDGLTTVKQNEWQRKNAHPYDEDGDGLLDEDPPEDEDGDGYIEDLYYWNGTDYYFIRWEGIDNDSDGLYNEDWVGGVDINRNYGYQWNATVESGSPYPWAEDYRGPAPFSEPETRAIRNLALSNDFKYAISFHSGAESIGYPWGYTYDPTPDDAFFREIGANLSALVGAPYGPNSNLYTLSGSWDDWMYANRSTFALTCEVYGNDSAWRYEPGPEPYTWWEGGIFQAFNPDPHDIETVVQRWLPVFTYITDRAIAEATTETHDITTTNVTPLKTIVGQGFSMHINVTVTNQGDFTETFNVTVYANTTSIATQTVTLTSGNSTTITFTWNTTGFAKGNYTISAYAWPVIGEADTDDNTLPDGLVTVTIPGDCAGTDPMASPWCDGKVFWQDLLVVLVGYGATPADPRWTNYHLERADFNSDNQIFWQDLLTILVNYGKSDC